MDIHISRGGKRFALQDGVVTHTHRPCSYSGLEEAPLSSLSGRGEALRDPTHTIKSTSHYTS